MVQVRPRISPTLPFPSPFLPSFFPPFLSSSLFKRHNSNRWIIAATIVRVAGGRVNAALNTLYVLSAVGTEGRRGVILVVHHSGLFPLPSLLRIFSLSGIGGEMN